MTIPNSTINRSVYVLLDGSNESNSLYCHGKCVHRPIDAHLSHNHKQQLLTGWYCTMLLAVRNATTVYIYFWCSDHGLNSSTILVPVVAVVTTVSVHSLRPYGVFNTIKNNNRQLAGAVPCGFCITKCTCCNKCQTICKYCTGIVLPSWNPPC